MPCRHTHMPQETGVEQRSTLWLRSAKWWAAQIPSHITIHIIPEFTHLGLKTNKGGALHFKQFYFSLSRSLNVFPKLKKMRMSGSCCLWSKSEPCLSCTLHCWAGHTDSIESNKNWDVAPYSFAAGAFLPRIIKQFVDFKPDLIAIMKEKPFSLIFWRL